LQEHIERLLGYRGAKVNSAASQIYAVEGSCFVVAPCAVISQEMIDLMCDTPDKHQLILVGGSFTVIYGPDGARIGDKLAPDQEGIVYTDIDLAIIPVAKAAADPAGHYARPTLPGFCSTVVPQDRSTFRFRPAENGGVCVSSCFPAQNS
jgi:aliphatic nitrilase